MQILPIKYRLRIYPNANSKKFSGSVEIYIQIIGSSNKIVLNAKELEIKSAEVISNGSSQIPKVKLDKEKQELILELDKPVKKNAVIKIEYVGIHNEELYGFYLSKYKMNGKEETLLTTQFESSDARAAFPCFDNPSMKAVFELTLVIDKELEAISN
ncbi:MAG: M1 family peptidase, partial [Candidatus Micrarchaeota archaeon]